MNNSFIKYFSIFLILLFCLSPLGAIDLSQGENSTQINDNDTTDFKDSNATVIADDMEIKSDNGSDDKKAIDNDVKIQKVSVNDSNSTKNLQASDAKLSMEVEDTVYGEGATIKIYFKNSNFGYAFNQKVIIQGINYFDTYTETFKGGCNIVKLRDDMPPGSYSITYNYNGGSSYTPATVTARLTVHKRDSGIECSVEDVDYGQAPVVKIRGSEHLDPPYAYISSPQFSREYKFRASEVSTGVNISESLSPGEYTCYVYYLGDSYHNPLNKTLNFKVNYLKPNLTVKAEDILKGENLQVEVHANEALNGDLTCKVIPAFSSNSSLSSKNNSQTIHLVDGVGYATIDCHDLSPGKYIVCTGFEGNEFFTQDLVLTNFKVNENHI